MTGAGQNPGILVLHDWYGMSDHVRVRAEILARLGYVALAGDVYGARIRPDGDEEAQAAARPFYDDPALFRSRVRANFARLLDDPAVDPRRVGVIGYCFGGTGALELARSGGPVQAAVCVHGFLSTAAPAAPGAVTASVLVLTGAGDPLVPAAQVRDFRAEMTGADVVDWQVVSYGGAMHGFALPEADAPEMGVRFEPTTNRRAWTALQDFLAESLAQRSPADDRSREIKTGFAHLHAADPVLAALIDRRPGYDADAWRRELPASDLFGCLVFQITGQQISLTSAAAVLGRLTDRFGGMPSPAELAGLSEQTLRDLGLSWRKARTVLDLAARFADKRLSEERLTTLDDDQVIAELTQINGIGPWTVQGALLIALRRADVVPTGDIMLRNTIRTLYALDHVPSEQEVLDIADAWHPYGSLGVNLIFAAAELDSPSLTATS